MARHEEKAFQEGLQRIEALIQTIQTTADLATRASAEELVQALLDLHGAGIERMLELIWEAGAAGETIIDNGLARDDLVGSLLLLHGLHPLDLETRVTQALEKVRPYLGSHGGNVELLGVADGVVRLRLQGSCDGCPSSMVTLKYAIEDGIYAAAPDVTGIEVEGVVDRPYAPPAGAFIPLQVVSAGNGAAVRWRVDRGRQPCDAQGGAVRTIDVAGQPALFCRVGGTCYAYSNTCPNCNQLLGQAKLAGPQLTCATCGHRYDVMRAGRDLDEPRLNLEPVPLLEEQGRVRVALPALQL